MFHSPCKRNASFLSSQYKPKRRFPPRESCTFAPESGRSRPRLLQPHFHSVYKSPFLTSIFSPLSLSATGHLAVVALREAAKGSESTTTALPFILSRAHLPGKNRQSRKLSRPIKTFPRDITPGGLLSRCCCNFFSSSGSFFSVLPPPPCSAFAPLARSGDAL